MSNPNDPTPSAAVAPTGGETVTRYDLCCGEESAWMEPGPTGAYVLFEDVRAALSSPVRAEPRQGPFMCDLHSPPLIFETADDAVRHFEATKHNYTLAPVRAERGEAERIATLEMALRKIASAADRRALMIEDFLAHTKLRSAVFSGTASAMRSWSSLARAALTPTPPATPTEPKHVCGLQGYNPMIDPPCPGCVPATPTPSEERPDAHQSR